MPDPLSPLSREEKSPGDCVYHGRLQQLQLLCCNKAEKAAGGEHDSEENLRTAPSKTAKLPIWQVDALKTPAA